MPKLSEIDQKPEDFMKAINDFVAKPQGFFIIAGKNGNGKTFSAKAIYENFWHPHHDNLFYTQVDLNLKWHSDLNKWGDTIYFLQQLVNAPLLIIDDLGTRVPSPAFMDFLYAVTDKRYGLKDTHGTIITTNLTSKAMREQFGDAFVSRVASGLCVRHDGEDRRFKEF